MWIRSQDRKALLNVNQVLISPSVDGSIHYINDSLGEESNVLGVYSTEEKTLKDNGLYEAYDDMVLIKQALIERDRKIYGLQQHTRNLEDKLGRIGGYHYGNPKQ